MNLFTARSDADRVRVLDGLFVATTTDCDPKAMGPVITRTAPRNTPDRFNLDGADATNVGILLAATRTSDIADAHVVICARRNGEHIVTSDLEDLRSLDPTASLIVVDWKLRGTE